MRLTCYQLIYTPVPVIEGLDLCEVRIAAKEWAFEARAKPKIDPAVE